MPLSSHLRTLLSDHPIAVVAEKVGVAKSTLHSWLTQGSSARLPEPRHLEDLLDLVEASAEERAQAWSGLAEADRERAKHRPGSNRPVGIGTIVSVSMEPGAAPGMLHQVAA